MTLGILRTNSVSINVYDKGFLGGSVVKNLPATAGDTDLIPDPGKSYMPRSSEACAPQLLSLCSRVRELQLRSPYAATTEGRML